MLSTKFQGGSIAFSRMFLGCWKLNGGNLTVHRCVKEIL